MGRNKRNFDLTVQLYEGSLGQTLLSIKMLIKNKSRVANTLKLTPTAAHERFSL